MVTGNILDFAHFVNFCRLYRWLPKFKNSKRAKRNRIEVIALLHPSFTLNA